MKDALLVFQFAMALIPVILPIIHSLETTGLPGQDKLKILVDGVLASIKLLPPSLQAKLPVDGIVAFATTITNTIVGLLNLAGIFKPTPPADTTEKDQLIAHIAHMKKRLSGLDPYDVRVGNLTANIKEAEDRLATLP